MASPPLTIRNLTSISLELKLVERYEAPSVDPPSGIGHITRNFTTLMSNATAPTSPQLTDHSQSFSNQDVSLRLEPFQTSKTEIKASERSPNETLRLTFEADGERYRLDTPTPTNESTTLTPLTPNPRFKYTAVFLPQYSHLSLFSSANLQSWMQELKDETPLSALSVPGTHNSPTCHRALPSVRCQSVSPRVQLDNGVRFFDIRVQPEKPEDPSNDRLILVHGVFPISLTGNKYFRDLVNEVEAFLDRNPSETVIMSVKREGTGTATDANLSRILRDHYAGDVNRWFTAPHIPTLGEARRKVVLMRRFALEEGLKKEWDGAGWCINAETWAYNTPNDQCPSGDVVVQDFCEVLETENIDKKIKFSEEHLERAASCVCVLPGISTQSTDPPPKQPFYINFLSASNFWKVGCWPEKIAAKLNPAIVDFLCRRHNEVEGIGGRDGGEGRKDIGDGSTGIVVCDWVGNNGDWDLVRCIVGYNEKLALRERKM
ncbi:MAG: hypothetical protein M1827_003330 [Pycnora praestabilis]|nr:MAG: hypothetical protein M1827_003330 [Pycnora praestabilis]